MLRVAGPATGLLVLLLLALLAPARAQPDGGGWEGPAGVSLLFPTDNESILHYEPARFYMGLVRNYGREREWTWEGGTYGYVRNARQTPVGWRFTRFHEGIDIAPLYRDARGEPLDEVRAVDEGRVVYVNANPRGSDYGRYVVVEHVWEGSLFYTLYAHLGVTAVQEGEWVAQGERLGVVGYSGTGLDRERAHLHFEINLLLNEHFYAWRDARHTRWSATHGRYHGYNLAGVAPVEVLERSRGARAFSLVDLLRHQPADVMVHVPGGPPPDLLRRYPWMCRSCDGGAPEWAPGWEVSLSRAGLPLRVEPMDRHVTGLRLVEVEGFVRADYLASRLLTRQGPDADLNRSARDLLALLFARPGHVPNW